MRRTHLGLLFLLCGLYSSLTAGAPPQNAANDKQAPTIFNGCQPDGSPKDDTIDCTGVDLSGIDSSGGDDNITINADAVVRKIGIDPKPLAIAVNAGDGNDVVTNNGTIIATVTSLGNGLKSSPGNSAKNSSDDDSTLDDNKNATAIGIDGGAGADDITNTGDVTAISTTVAGGVSGGPLASDALALSVGVKGGDGADTITNDGSITAHADTVALKGNIPTGGGLSTSNDSSTSAATAIGIHGGDGSDNITNNGVISAIANSVIVTAGTPDDDAALLSSRDSGNTAEATATGISGGGGGDTIDNFGEINATATAGAQSITIAVSATGAATAKTTSTAKSSAIGIDAGQGNDTVANDGSITSVATSISGGQAAVVSDSGNNPYSRTTWKGEVVADSSAVGVKTGAGVDDVTNNGNITAVATSVTVTSAVSAAVTDVKAAESTATAKSNAIGIDTGDGDDTVTNNGTIDAVATATAGALDLVLSQEGSAEAAHEGGPTAEATATGISADGAEETTEVEIKPFILPHRLTLQTRLEKMTASGNDTITNTDAVTAIASAVSSSVGAAVSISGAATSDMRAKASATATGINAGSGNDTVTNSGEINAVSTATAGAVGISFSESGTSNIKGGPEAEATAVGISGDGGLDTGVISTTLDISTEEMRTVLSETEFAATGADTITNNENVTAVATAVSGSEGGAISISGAAAADTKSTSKATATALDAGAGDDVVTNNGNLTAVSTATAGAVGISFSESGESTVKGGPEAEATAIGISADGTQGDTLFQSSITVDLQAPGVTAGILYTSDAKSGVDTVTNNDDVTAVATAVSGGAAGAVAISGAASADTTAKAKATATAVDAGDGDDKVTNNGNLTAVATATAGAVGVSFSESDDSSAGAGAEAEAVATGISGDGGPKSTLTQADIGVRADGVDLGFRYENDAATGDDTITNNGVVSAVATALSGAGNGGISVSGDASVDAESTAKSRAVGIDAGAGDDTVKNNGALTAVSTATAGVLGIGVSESGEAEVEGGPTADATAIGISGDGTRSNTLVDVSLAIDGSGLNAGALYQDTAASGTDTIDNTSAITTVATAISGTEGIAVSVKEAASTDVSSEATSTATAIEAGGGDDMVTNSGVLTSVATSLAGTVGGSISEGDKANADASATARSAAIGIAGDGGLHDSTVQATLDIDKVEGVNTTISIEQISVGGDDKITNTGVITSVSNAVAAAGSVALSVDKTASANAAASAESVAKAIDGGAGNDTINNSGVLTSVSTATAGEVAASISMKGNATGLKSIWQGGAEADATAIGISGDSNDKDFSSSFELDVDFVEEQVIVESHLSYVQAGGDDMITNDGVITATAVATTPSANIAIAAEDMAAAVSTSEASATAIALDGGSGNDTITNNGALVSTAVATALTANVAVSKKSSLAADSIWNGGTTAEANAVGISGDGAGDDLSVDGIIAVSKDVVQVAGSISSTTVSGDDNITNEGEVVVTSLAITPTANVAVSVKGAGAAISASEANASAIGIDAGAGNDIVVNDAALVVTSGATAVAANVAVSKSAAIAGNSIWDGGIKAEAEAVGISGDGDGRDFEASAGILVTADLVQAGAGISSTVVSGNDDITNDASITATSVAAAPSLSVAVSAKGLSASVSEATANSTATGIDAGAGDDFVDNSGVITASSLATAAVANVAVTGGGVSAAWDGGTTAKAEAVGISGDGDGRDYEAEAGILVTDDLVRLGSRVSSTVVNGNDTIENNGVITATSVAIVPSVSVAVSAKGVSAAVSDATANALSIGIDAGAGDDEVTNNGVITTTSLANATAVNVAVTGAGVSAAWDGSTLAEAESVGISGDGEGQDYLAENSVAVTEDAVRLSARLESTEASGNDRITNEGVITTTSVAVTPSLAVAVTPSGGLSAAVTSAEAKSRAATIDAGSGNDIVDNSGDLTSSAVSLAGAVSVAVTGGGLSVAGNSVWDGGTHAEAEAIGIDGDGEGRDQVAVAALDVTGDGVVLSAERSDREVSGDDDITNTGVITASSLASATSVGVSVTLSGGVSAAVSTSTADARAAGIDGGSGNDIIDNQGVITATAAGNANTLSVAYATVGGAIASDAVMDGGTTAEAEAIGIDGDGEGSNLSITGLIETSDTGTTISGRIVNELVSGNDDITNNSVITATAASLAPSIGVAVTPGGLAVALTTATAKARSAGIDAGSGDDVVNNTGTLTATSSAVAVAVPVTVTPVGVAIAADAFWDGGTTAEAEAVGISGDGVGTDFVSEASIGSSSGNISVLARDSEAVVSGDDTINNDGTVTATAAAEALSIAVSVTPAGLAVAASTSTANSRSAAIDAGSGDDYVDNSGTLTSTSVANANALSVAITPAGLSVASGPVWDGGTHANAQAIGISGDGESRDHVSEFVANVDEFGTRVIASDSWTTVSGEDEIINSGNIAATAVAVAPSLGVAITPAGVSVASSTATASAKAFAIDAGAGNDDIDNSGDIVARAVANADAVSVTVTPAGVTVSADSVWDGGTTAHSEAIGISGDGEGSDDTIEASITANDTGVGLYVANRSLMVSGNDTITNTGSVEAAAVSVVPSIGVAVTPAGLSVALSRATTTAHAAAIDAGSGNDYVDNTNDLTATATSVSIAIPVAVTPAGVAIAADAVWDGGTSAGAEAVGIAGDGEGTDIVDEFSIAVIDGEVGIHSQYSATAATGDDTILNNAEVTSTAVAVAGSVAVSVTPAGVSVSASTATANAQASAIDAGSGDDFVDNDGKLTSTATAVATAVPVAVAPVGFGVALDAIWDGGTSAAASAIGIDTDGQGTDFTDETTIRAGDAGTLLRTRTSSSGVSGDDEIDNSGGVDVTAVAVAPSVAFSLGVVGGVSAANATTDAYAAAIDAGAGDDDITNSGALTATAVSNANSLAIAVGAVSGAGNAIMDGGTTADAVAVGIYGDGHDGTELTEFALSNDGVNTQLTRAQTTSNAAGDDEIDNSGQIDATAVAVAPAGAIALGLGAVSVATATSQAYAAAIDAGAGDDEVSNTGQLSATAVANADSITIAGGIGALAANSILDGGTTAVAEATGISGDGRGGIESSEFSMSSNGLDSQVTREHTESDDFGNDTITNEGQIDASAVAVSPSLSESIGALSISLATSTARSQAAAIDAGGGNDTVFNYGVLTANATSVAATANISQMIFPGLGIAADAIWDGGTTAEANAVGISGDGRGAEESTVRGLAVNEDGFQLFEHTSSSSLFGNDEIYNEGSIEVGSVAVAVSAGLTAPVPSPTALIPAPSGAVTATTSTARAGAGAIIAGGGSDSVTNHGALTADATAVAVAARASINVFGVSASLDAVWDGGTTAEADAVGIDGDGSGGSTATDRSIEVTADSIELVNETSQTNNDDDDVIVNTAAIDATSLANSTSVGVSATLLVGVAAAVSTSTAEATADAIRAGGGDDTVLNLRAGGGDDTVLNQGVLTATSSADADAVSVSFTPLGATVSADSFWDGGTTAVASAGGIDGGAGDDNITNELSVVATSAADATSVGVSISVFGVAAALSEATAEAQSTAIDGDAGNDTITNSGELTAMSAADAQAVSVSVGLVGFAASDSSALADAGSIGIDAGNGDNTVDNSGNITAGAAATAAGTSVTVEVVGVGMSDPLHDGETRAEASAAGMVGGDGADEFTNNADIILASTADISSTSVTVNLAGFSSGDASATAEAAITGMDGGDSLDTLVNHELIAGSAMSTAPGRTSSIGLIGASNADVSTEAIATATGMAGGAGDDGVYNLGAIGLAADASGEAKAVTVTLAGAAHADADTTATAIATGQSGGDGADEVFNFGGVGVTATATAEALGISVEIIGVASQSASSTSTATAVGLDGGSGDDAVANIGFLSSSSIADASMSNASWTLVGASSQLGLVTANASSYGMSGGFGDDVLFNDGEVDVDVASALTTDGTVTAVLGGGSGNISIASTLRGFGMAGGEGNDQVLNADLVSVNSSLVSTSTGTAWNLAGLAGGTTGINTNSALFGLSGGIGDDILANTGSLLVGANSIMSASGSSWTFAGASSGASRISSVASATGMAGDSGADWLYNESLVDVSATSTLESTAVSFAFIGGASSGTSLSALARATGLQGGDGADQLFNGGSLLVDAVATNLATGGAQTVVGDAAIVTVTAASAVANGLDTGIGDDIGVNVGTLDITSFANPNSVSDVDAGGFFVDGISRSHTNSVSNAQGANLGDGANLFLNEGDVLIEAGGSGSASAASTGSALSLTADAFADANASVSASTSSGITAGDGANQLNNQSLIDVDATIATNATANADGAGLLEGAGAAHAEVSSNAVSAIGINAGHGNNLIANGGNGNVFVNVANTAAAESDSNARGIDFFTAPHSNADADAFAHNALAVGINVGDGDNSIWNGSDIVATAAPMASAVGKGLSIDFGFAVDSFADAVSSANDAHAFGIRAGNGANVIQNVGSIDSISSPTAASTAIADGRGWDGDAEATAIAKANGALAVGIFAGDGGNLVVNEGTIYALASPTATVSAIATPGGAELAGAVSETLICTWTSKWQLFQWVLTQVCRVVTEIADGAVDDGEAVAGATAKADDARAIGILLGDGDNIVVNQGAIYATATPSSGASATAPSGSPPEVEIWETTSVSSAEAIGIQTGSGNDVIVNEGSIETRVIAGAVNRHGIAIQSGAGNDTVILQDGSVIIGDVDLGADDDFLYLLGMTNSTGNFDGGIGTDRLMIDGTSLLVGGAFGFEKLKLYGTSRFTLNSLGPVGELDIQNGTLNVNGNYQFAPAGLYNVNVYSDGSHGQINVGGTAVLDGDLQVARDSGPYTDGTSYDVVTAGAISGNFENEILPAPTTLVSFSVEQNTTEVNVVANVIPFASMASGASETAVAEYLDDIVGESTGELSTLLASMQAMPEDDFGTAFRSLNPGTYNAYQVTDRTMRDHLSGTHSRLMSMRANLVNGRGDNQSTFLSDRESLYLSGGSTVTRFADPQVGDNEVSRVLPAGVWTVGYVSSTDQGNAASSLQGAGFTTAGFSMGVDSLLGDNLAVGISLGSAVSSLNIDGGYGEGELGSELTSIYSTFLPSENTYVDAIVSRSGNYFSNQRNITISALERDTSSGHRSDLFSTFIEAGRISHHGRRHSEFFGSVYYSSMNEDGFEELGAGATNIIVDPRRYETLSAEIGWRNSWNIETRNGFVAPKFNVAYLHDFDFGDELMSARFSGAPDISFSPAGRDISGNGIRLGFGLKFVTYRGWIIESQLGGEFSERRRTAGGALQVHREF